MDGQLKMMMKKIFIMFFGIIEKIIIAHFDENL